MWKPSGYFREVYLVRNDTIHFKAYGSGSWIEGREWTRVVSPIDGSVLGYIPRLTYGDVEGVIETIHNRGRWSIRDLPGYRRVEVMERVADLMEEYMDDLVEALVLNSGKTYQQARGEVKASISRLRDSILDARKVPGEYIAGDWDKSTLETEGIVRKEPYGVVLGIIPFNYPLFDAVAKFVYSSVAGNAVILKPPSIDPIPVLLFAKLVVDAGFPRESFAVLTMPGSETSKLVSDDRIQVVSLTGSSETGRKVLAAGGVKQYIMELGGGDPAIVLRDADLGEAAKAVASGIYSYAGQRCDAIKIVLVEEGIYEEFKKLLVEELSKVNVGDPRDESTTMGPLISREAVEEMMIAVKDALSRGGKLLYGGRDLGGNYVEPTLIEFTDHGRLVETKLYREEVFAPVALITSFKELDEAIKLSNGRRYGLDAAVFGRDIDRIRKLIRYLEVGAVYVNDMPRHGVGYYPFGGRKASGIGREGIGYSIEYVMATKTIIYNYRGRGIYHYLV